jgi:ABC-type transport system substrate-binding protein
MLSKNKWFLAIALTTIVATILAACGPTPTPQVVEVTRVVAGTPETVEVEVTTVPEEVVTGPIAAEGLVPCLPLPEVPAGSEGSRSAPGVASLSAGQPASAPQSPAAGTTFSPRRQAGTVYRVGVFEDATTMNYFAANGPDNTVWNSYMLPARMSLYTLSDQRFDFVPLLAEGLPPALTQEGDFWVAEVPMRGDVSWSDGEPFTAEDVAWTANTVVKFGLISGNWSSWYDSNYLDHVEAMNATTVKYFFHTKPGLARYEYGILQAPILAAHFWAPLVDEAAAPIDALAADASAEDIAAAQATATDSLFAIVPDGEPLAGGFLFTRWEQGAFLETSANPDYFYSGVTVTEYANGAYQESKADVSFTLYGEATGDVQLQFTVGPYVDQAIYTIYGSQDAAVLALKNGDIDFLLNSLGLQRGLLDQVEGDPNLTVLQNSTNGFRYLSFNERRRPMNDCSFRQAVAVLIDKETVTQRVLQGVAFPLYSFVPEANAAWYDANVPMLGQGLTREQRLGLAIAILEQAGYSWENDQKPTWDPDGEQVVPGARLIMPDGTPVPPLDLWAPSAGYDPMRSTFAVWIESWLNEAGIPVTAHLAGFNALIPRIFTEQNFDMYILGWSLSVFPSYMRDFWHSEQAVPDGNNAGGYTNPEFDSRAEQLMTCESFEACKQISDELQTMLSTEVPYVVLFDTGIIEPYRSAAVEYPYTANLSGLQLAHQGPGQPMQSYVTVR